MPKQKANNQKKRQQPYKTISSVGENQRTPIKNPNSKRDVFAQRNNQQLAEDL